MREIGGLDLRKGQWSVLVLEESLGKVARMKHEQVFGNREGLIFATDIEVNIRAIVQFLLKSASCLNFIEGKKVSKVSLPGSCDNVHSHVHLPFTLDIGFMLYAKALA